MGSLSIASLIVGGRSFTFLLNAFDPKHSYSLSVTDKSKYLNTVISKRE
jgi:hypothetical protein